MKDGMNIWQRLYLTAGFIVRKYDSSKSSDWTEAAPAPYQSQLKETQLTSTDLIRIKTMNWWLHEWEIVRPVSADESIFPIHFEEIAIPYFAFEVPATAEHRLDLQICNRIWNRRPWIYPTRRGNR